MNTDLNIISQAITDLVTNSQKTLRGCMVTYSDDTQEYFVTLSCYEDNHLGDSFSIYFSDVYPGFNLSDHLVTDNDDNVDLTLAE